MLRKIASLAAAGAATFGIVTAAVAPAANAATPRHSDIYVNTIVDGWVPQDQLTAGEIQLLDNEPTCAPVQTAILVDEPQYVGGYQVPVIAKIEGRYLVSQSNASAAQLGEANFSQVGLTGIPSFLGPTAYVETVTSTGAIRYSCPK